MKLEVKNGKITQVIINEMVFPLKKSIKLNEAEKLEEIAKFLEEYFDFSDIMSEVVEKKDKDDGFEWTKDELIDFLDETSSERQRIFLRSLAENPEKLTREQLEDIMEKEGEELPPFSMAGILSCLTRRAKHYGKKEDFWESIWDEENYERFYRLKERYREIFARYFGVNK